MLAVIFRGFRWAGEKLAVSGLIVGLGLTACGLWLFLKDNVDFDEWRHDLVRTITGEKAKTQTALADVRQRMDKISAEIAAEQERGRQTDKVIAQLKALSSTWDKLTGNEQQKSNDAQLAKMTALRATITAKVSQLQQDFTHATWERDGLEIAINKIDVRLREAQAHQSKIMHYLDLALGYRVGYFTLKTWILVTLALYFFGPSVGKVALFFLVAPWIERGAPVQLESVSALLPEISARGVSVELDLAPGEQLWVKEKILQASDEGLRKKTRYVLDWRLPFTCLAAGLVELIEMRHAGQAGEGSHRVTLSNQRDPHSELAVLTLPAGASLVLRPSFLAGAVTGGGQRLAIRRRWQLFRWQAWVTLQFRFFEFAGPCRLVVAGTRGVRVERLDDRPGVASVAAPVAAVAVAPVAVLPARRTNQDATIGFTPNLAYRPVRAETFWSYFRGMNPLFDDLFAGRGIFLCQQVSTAGDAAQARKFWAGVWGGVMKVFGL